MLFSIPDWTNRGQNIRPSKPRSPMPNMSATVQPCPAEQRLCEKPISRGPPLAHAASPAAPLASLAHGERIENTPQRESSPNGPHSLSLRGKTCNPLKIKTAPNFEGFVVSCLGCRFFGPFWLRYHYRLRLQTRGTAVPSASCLLIVDSTYAFGSRTTRRVDNSS